MKYFFDTEFIEDGKTIELLSIGIVAEDGREFYACNDEANFWRADQWVRENVFPSLGVFSNDYGEWDFTQQGEWFSRAGITSRILSFIGNDPTPEFWAYYADYDWVVLCQLFGRMIDLPKGWPMYCRDVKQLCDSLGNPKLPEQSSAEHHALHDARWTKEAYLFLQKKAEQNGGADGPDARLIAAVPDMYEALRDLLQYLDDHDWGTIPSGGITDINARAALQKAEGKAEGQGE